MTKKINKKAYADMYGPSVGDRVSFEGIEIVIQSTIGRRIGKLRIRTK